MKREKGRTGGRPSELGKGRLTGPQWHNQFNASKTLSVPFDMMCRLWVMSGYSSAIAITWF